MMNHELSTWWVLRTATIISFAALLSALLIIVLRPLLGRYALARPNVRSSHKIPTPQGGGIAVVAATIIAVYGALHFWTAAGSVPELLLIVFGAVILIACVGAADDIRSIEVIPRLLLQALAVALMIYALPDDLRIAPFMPWWIERVLLVVGGVWFVNLVNFMDGIDWMSVAEVIPLTAGFVVLGAVHALPLYGTVVALALGGAMLGFAYFNRPIASVFLGDVGSLPIGLILGWLLLLVAGGGHLVAATVMPLYYLADASVTLIRRLIHRERFWQAHRTHFYQLATERGYAVIGIVVRVFLVNVCLCSLALMTVILPGKLSGSVALVASTALVTGLLFVFARGKK
jgi:UDP-N-acetylmuramyl pentapeptide phosphotransferase/UDP-N-acetylglucosamine-1-phosphate transferase